MSDTAQQGRTWQSRADNADRIMDDRATDRILDDIERYEPTPLVDPPNDVPTALIGVACLLSAGLIAAAFAVKWMVGW